MLEYLVTMLETVKFYIHQKVNKWDLTVTMVALDHLDMDLDHLDHLGLHHGAHQEGLWVEVVYGTRG
jgi:hypothetical protein